METKPATLSEIALHLGVTRTTARDCELQGILNRTAGIDACRLAYIRHLRARRSNTADDRLRLGCEQRRSSCAPNARLMS